MALGGYAGPLDLLLDLARTQKVDLRTISMLTLVEQYLAFVDAAKARRLELAADYLVMAAWLTYLKSKLLLPLPEKPGDEPTADEMAARLAFQLQRLEAMRRAADALMGQPRLGVDFHPRGNPDGVTLVKTPDWQADLFDLLSAYARQRVSRIDRTYTVEHSKVFPVEEARRRLARLLGGIPDWVDLATLLPSVMPAGEIDAPRASVIASAFNAALEFARDGALDLMQLGPYEPLYVRRRDQSQGPLAASASPDPETIRPLKRPNR